MFSISDLVMTRITLRLQRTESTYSKEEIVKCGEVETEFIRKLIRNPFDIKLMELSDGFVEEVSEFQKNING